VPIYSPHHVIPDVLKGKAGSTVTQTIMNVTNTTVTATTTTTTTSRAGVGAESLGTYALAALIILLFSLILVSVILIMGYRREPEFREKISGKPSVYLETSYRYSGVKAVLRRLFLALRSVAERKTGKPLTSKTVFEVALLLGGRALRFAKRYAYLMYSRYKPRESDVEELKKDAEGLIDNWSGSREQ